MSLRFVGSLVASAILGLIFDTTWVLLVKSRLATNWDWSGIKLEICSVFVILMRLRYGFTSYLCFTGVNGGNYLRINSSPGASLILLCPDSCGAEANISLNYAWEIEMLKSDFPKVPVPIKSPFRRVWLSENFWELLISRWTISAPDCALL